MFKKRFSQRQCQIIKIENEEQGFTIVESLVAILVVSILLAAIAPVIALSVATRVQARRAELASQAARAYIDLVKAQKIAAPIETGSSTTLSGYGALTPTGTLTCPSTSTYSTSSSYTYCTAPSGASLYCVDFDNTGNCETTSNVDMIVQGFRYNQANSNTNAATTGYTLGVRVYRADAFKDTTALLKNTKQSTYAAGVGQRKAPLVEMTTEISDTVPKYSDLCARITGGCNN